MTVEPVNPGCPEWILPEAVLPGGRITYRLKYVSRGRGKHRVMTPMEFMARLSAIVAAPRYPLLRYAGVLAPRSKWRRDVVPRPRERREACAAAPTQARQPPARAARRANDPVGPPSSYGSIDERGVCVLGRVVTRRLVYGRPADVRTSARGEVALFSPGALVAYELSAARRSARLFVFRTLFVEDRLAARVPGVHRRVQLLFTLRARVRIERLRQIFTRLDALGWPPEGLPDAFFIRLGASFEGRLPRRPILASLLPRALFHGLEAMEARNEGGGIRAVGQGRAP